MTQNKAFLNPIKPYALLAALMCWFGSAGAALAQSYDTMSCDQLWYARNAIYAAKGYCFKTARAQQTFGTSCFPPYGNLSPAEESQVNYIRSVERSRGCSSGGGGGGGLPPPAGGGYAQMSCDDLWYARNEIYAAKGYCFKTARARQAFGSRCYPPYGDLNAQESRQVSAIKDWERRKGCR